MRKIIKIFTTRCSHFKAKTHQILFPASVHSFVSNFISKTDGRSVRLWDEVWLHKSCRRIPQIDYKQKSKSLSPNWLK